MKTRSTKIHKAVAAMLMVLPAIALVACSGSSGGGDSSGSSSGGNTLPAPTNVAASTNGGVASATYDGSHAFYVNDGDATTSNFWAGNIQNDSVTVAFDKTYNVSEVKLHTNATNNTDTKIQISTNGTDFTDISYTPLPPPSPYCSSLILNSVNHTITCSISSVKPASHVRIVIVASTNIGLKQIYEVEATGQ